MSDKDFKVMIVKMLTRLERRVEELNENFNKEIENTKKKKKQSHADRNHEPILTLQYKHKASEIVLI